MGKRPYKLQANAINNCEEIKNVILLIVDRLRHLKLTQKDLGDLAGLSQPTISQMLSGRHNVSYVAIQHVAKSIGIAIVIKATNKARSKDCKAVMKQNKTKRDQRNRRLEINSASKSGIRTMKVMDDE